MVAIVLVISCDCSESLPPEKDCLYSGDSNAEDQRKGFGEKSSHGEKRISFLSDTIHGHDAFENYVVYVNGFFKPVVIDLKCEIEMQINDPFFSDIKVLEPRIWRNKIVFKAIPSLVGRDEPTSGIAIYDLRERKGTLLMGPGLMDRPSIFENLIVWDDTRFSSQDKDPGMQKNREVFLYNTSDGKETRITNAPYQQMNPKIYCNHIVWRDCRDPNQTEIFLYSISDETEINITNHPSLQWYPSIWEENVVWTDLRNGTGDSVIGPYTNTDVYLYNLKTKETRQITKDESDQEGARIYGQYIVWNDFRNGGRLPNGYPSGCDIYLYDLENEQEKRVTWSTENDFGAVVLRDKVIWLSQRGGVQALYMKSLSEL